MNNFLAEAQLNPTQSNTIESTITTKLNNTSTTLPTEDTNKQILDTQETPLTTESTKDQIKQTDITTETTNTEGTESGEKSDEVSATEDQQTQRTRKYYAHQIFIAARTENYNQVFQYCMEMKQVQFLSCIHLYIIGLIFTHSKDGSKTRYTNYGNCNRYTCKCKKFGISFCCF